MKRRVHALQRGFTLLEVVVAIAIFALLMSLVYSGFSTAVRAYDAAEQRVNEVERMRVVSAFIRRSVSGAHAIAIAVRREWVLQFEGSSDRLRYIADLPGYVGVGGVHEVQLELEGSGEQHDLVMRRRPLMIDRFGELQGEFETRVLAEKINSFVLRFYGPVEGSDELAWHDEWQVLNAMPALVELLITPESGPTWPVLQIRPQVDSIRYLNASAIDLDNSEAGPDDDDESQPSSNTNNDDVLPNARGTEIEAK